jgi:hypothetical protein
MAEANLSSNMKQNDSITIYVFGHISRCQLPIWEGDIPFESPKCPLKSCLFKFPKIQTLKKIHVFEWNNPNLFIGGKADNFTNYFNISKNKLEKPLFRGHLGLSNGISPS